MIRDLTLCILFGGFEGSSLNNRRPWILEILKRTCQQKLSWNEAAAS